MDTIIRMPPSIKFTPIICIIAALFVGSCDPSVPAEHVQSTKTPFPTNTLVVEAAVQTPSHVPTNTPSPVPPTVEPSPTVCPGDGIFCADSFLVSEVTGNFRDGVWSPTENTMMVLSGNPQPGLVRLSQPDFSSVDISFSEPGYGPSSNVLWSQDGKNVFTFAYDSNEPDPRKAVLNTLWSLRSTERTVLPLHEDYQASYPTLLGWMDADTLVVSSDCTTTTCLDVLDIRSGEVLLTQNFRGLAGEPNTQYVPIMYTNAFPGVGHVGVVGMKNTGFQSQEPDEKMEHVQWLSFDGMEQADLTLFADWLPGTNQMLVSWTSIIDNGSSLYLWDIDQNQSRLLVPGGLTGTFSPDGKTLAYLSNGPNAVVPVDFMNFIPYLQVFDMDTQTVLSAFPIAAELDYFGAFPRFNLEYKFSPDGRYLAYITPEKNVMLFNTDDRTRTTISRPITGNVTLGWSFDSQYLSVEVRSETGENTIGLVKLP